MKPKWTSQFLIGMSVHVLKTSTDYPSDSFLSSTLKQSAGTVFTSTNSLHPKSQTIHHDRTIIKHNRP